MGTDGSPPQVRGKPGYTDDAKKPLGITPAGAGKTVDLDSDCGDAWDHPRRCGENSFQAWLAANGLGSPPQVRGKRFLVMP